MLIYPVSLGESGAETASKAVKDLLESLGGKVVHQDYWGKRKFAYRIQHQDSGFYDVLKFDLEASKLDDLKVKLNRMSEVLRYLITTLEE